LSNSNLDKNVGRSKRDPVFADITLFPKILFRFDRTYIIVKTSAELNERLGENFQGGKAHPGHGVEKLEKGRVWGESPADFGIETAPAAPPMHERPGTW
jgi:hypothetical protein